LIHLIIGSLIHFQMRKSFLIALILLAVIIPSSAAVNSSRRTGPAIQTIQFRSALLGKTLPYTVVLPRDYYSARVRRYPVLYLLHGLGGHYSDWTTKTNIAEYAQQYRMIVITPEGHDSWFTDSSTVPADKYESYFLKELIADVQRRYRTIETRHGRAIAGLSMGGYGALKFGLKSPGTFIFAGSLSGVTEAASWSEADLKNLAWIRGSLQPVFGPAGSETRKANDLFEIVRQMSAARLAALPYLYLDCGTEDVMFSSNERFAALLRAKKIPHEYRELPGNHSWAYWDQQVPEVLKIAARFLRAPTSD
jgi:S-formylglutathione hydrolase FrmB